MVKRYFEFVGEDVARSVAHSTKFWEAWVEEGTFFTRFGKIGSQGQTTVKEFGGPDDAHRAFEKAVSEKIEKGYVEAGGDSSGERGFFYLALVDEDSETAWQALRNQLHREVIAEDDWRIRTLGLSALSVDLTSETKVRSALKNASPGTVWGEFAIEPSLYLGEDFFVHVLAANAVIQIDSAPTLHNLTRLYEARQPRGDSVPENATSFLVIVCPRCQLTAQGGDVDADFHPDEESWTVPDCPSCGGTGEWQYDLLGGPDSSLEEEARALIEVCRSEQSSTADIDRVIGDHVVCAETQDHCGICSLLWSQDEDPARDLGLDRSIWTALSRRPDLTMGQQNQIFLAGVNEGRDAGLIPLTVSNLVRNAGVFPDNLKADLLDIHTFVGSILWDDYGSFASDLVRDMRANPAFPPEFIDEFISAHDDLNYDFDFDPGNSAALPNAAKHDSVSTVPPAPMGKCQECDSEVGPGAKFCPQCGASQRRIAFCSECGLARDGNAKFCGDCGTAYE